MNRNAISHAGMVAMAIVLAAALAGCTGVTSFGLTARAGDTVALPLGWQQNLSRKDVRVTITDSSSAQFTYLPGDPSVRSIFNSYPDPISNLIVGGETGQPGLGGSLAGSATAFVDASVTAGDKDYLQTFMLLDLPMGMSVGTANISVTDPAGNPIPNPSTASGSIDPLAVEIVAGVGTPNQLLAQEGLQVIEGYLVALERTAHYTVTFSGSTIPYAIQLDMVHAPDVDNGGTGKAYVVNPRGDLKSVNWHDDGTNMNIIIMPARDRTLSDIKQFKFYIAGGITGLSVSQIQAFDMNGNMLSSINVFVN